MSVADEPSLGKLSEGELVKQQKRAVRAFDRAIQRPVDARSPEAEQLLRELDGSLATIEAASAELARRQERAAYAQEAKEWAWARRERENASKKKAPHAALGAPLNFLKRTKPAALEGVNLDVARLTREEGEELAAIVKRFWDLPEGSERDPADVKRYELLVGKWAGDEHLFATYRRRQEAQRKMATIREEARVAKLPKRPIYAETGSVTVPRFVFEWLRDARDGEWTVADTGMLVVMLQQFENRIPLIAGARFDEEEGEPVLVIPGAIGGDIRFEGLRNGNSVDPSDSGHVRVREALGACVRNGWFRAEQAGGELRIKVGEHAKAVRQGKEDVGKAA